jgi:RsiW-degrading membrane proteinase PrsW (M82 family)
MTELLRIPVSLLPVLIFLSVLVVLDSYKLVSLRVIVRSIGAGCVAAVACLYLNGWLVGVLDTSHSTFTRYLAPPIEEAMKCLFVIYLIRTHRVGFSVDAAIHGFAVGTGFALVENAYFLRALDASSIFLWFVRGFGTAILHGSTTAIFAILSKTLTDRHSPAAIAAYLPGLGLAAGLHSLYNHFVLPPVIATAALLAVLPFVISLVFTRSEKATRRWLGMGFDADVELLELIESGEIQESRIGRYLESLRSRFPPAVVADMLCFLQIHHELAVRAKGMLIAHEAGFDLPPGPGVRANLEELRYLEKSIGKTGKLALMPFLGTKSRDLWQVYMLGES